MSDTKEEIELRANIETEYMRVFAGILPNEIDYDYQPLKFTPDELDNLDEHIIRIIRSPDNFYFTCKHIFGVELLPIQIYILETMWSHPFPILIGTRGLGKSFLLALYIMLRLLILQGTKVVIVGAGFRQAKLIFNYMVSIYGNAPVLQDLMKRFQGAPQGPRISPDRCVFSIGYSTATALPMGNGETIRGERANCVVADEFNSINREIYEKVIQGFGAVSASPVYNVKQIARRKAMEKLGVIVPDSAVNNHRTNQNIISGTAGYDFEILAEYYKNYKKIIQTKGEPRALAEVFGEDIDPEKFNWKDFCILQIPYDLLPEGFMDEKNIIRARATVQSGIFQMEYGAVFSKDSTGFFKRSLIEGCCTKTPIHLPSGKVQFPVLTRGASDRRYVMGIDPASESDNFAIVIIELHEDHRRVVHCWTTTRKKFTEKLSANKIDEHNFFAYCCRKIRDLMRAFNIELISLDAQGGGVSVLEGLHDADKLQNGEQMVWSVAEGHPLWDGKHRESDFMPGAHIVELVQFSRADWVAEANNGLKKDMEDKVILFPCYDAVDLIVAEETDDDGSLENTYYEIEELKTELSTIVHSKTPNGRDRWDTPEVKLTGHKKGRLHKDRYSALIMANMASRTMQRLVKYGYTREGFGGEEGGVVGVAVGDASRLPLPCHNSYTGPDWFKKGADAAVEAYGGISRNR